MPLENWALLEPGQTHVTILIDDNGNASIQNGKLTACLTSTGKLSFFNQNGQCLINEYLRNKIDLKADYCSALAIDAREFKPIIGGDYQLSIHFESLDENEHLYGMGQYQYPNLDLKGCDLELAHRNSQASVPFVLSSRGYGFLWNNPSIGRVVFGKNITTWEAFSTKAMQIALPNTGRIAGGGSGI